MIAVGGVTIYIQQPVWKPLIKPHLCNNNIQLCICTWMCIWYSFISCGNIISIMVFYRILVEPNWTVLKIINNELKKEYIFAACGRI